MRLRAMKNILVTTWEEFEAQILELRRKRDAHVPGSGFKPSDFLFRGQEDASKHLTTTLERRGHERMKFCDYYQLIFRIHSEIESFGFGRWNLRIPPEFERSLTWDSINSSSTPNQDEYGYMVHLRHLGFPSPLLDWTQSEYIAAFFAFRQSFRQQKNKNVAIFIYQRSPRGMHGNGSFKPFIEHHGPNVQTHPRHVSQKAEYTSCLYWEPKECYFAPHEEVFTPNNLQPGLQPAFEQDALWKFILPAEERLKVLRLIDDSHNVNAFSMFTSEESLLETLAVRRLDLPKEAL